ncbi:MAG: ABC transporter permease [Defluviitaleaceae bacterium]|nr:ABC transporter permease [Defluviitaleaceae bacterium]
MSMNKQIICAVSSQRRKYLVKNRRQKIMTLVCQFSLLFITIFLWEALARVGIIDSFIMSQPTRILRVVTDFRNNNLLLHIGVTFFETIVGFAIGVILGNLIALALWYSGFLSKVLYPYLVVINALPKIALGPVIIIWVGAGMQAVIVMALAISLVVTIMEMLNGFKNTDAELIKMAKTFGAGRIQTFVKIVFPSNLPTLFNCLKINIGLSLVGVIAGEFLVSRAGLGYLIVYGGQVFQMDLVMTSVFILAVLASVLYYGIVLLESFVMKIFSHKK